MVIKWIGDSLLQKVRIKEITYRMIKDRAAANPVTTQRIVENQYIVIPFAIESSLTSHSLLFRQKSAATKNRQYLYLHSYIYKYPDSTCSEMEVLVSEV